MIEVQPNGRFEATCDQCATASGPLQTATKAAARALLRATGWSFSDNGALAYCVRCGTVRATPSSRKLGGGKT